MNSVQPVTFTIWVTLMNLTVVLVNVETVHSAQCTVHTSELASRLIIHSTG